MQDWITQRFEPFMQTSATQHETFDRCRRLWWFKYVRRLFVERIAAGAFGTVLHNVAERYLNANDLGYDESGCPVDLYPEDWATDEGETLSPREQVLVKTLITKAIEEGILERRPGRKAEHEFKEPTGQFGEVTLHGLGWSKKVPVYTRYKGFIDLMMPGEIQDHKTSKSVRWLKSKAQLKKNLQILSYAYIAYQMELAAGGKERTSYVVRHNQFVKDPDKPQVRKTPVTVSLNTINNMWDHIIRNTEDMVRIRTRVNDPLLDLPREPRQKGACTDYGGCKFADICSGLKTVDEFNTDSMLTVSVPSDNSTRGKPMTDPLAALMGELPTPAAEPAAPATAVAVNPTVAAPVQAEEPATPKAKHPAPWATEGCPACGGTGFNSRGSVCRICLSKVDANDPNHPTQFTINTNDAGEISWVRKDGTGSGAAKVVEEVKAVDKTEVPAEPVVVVEPDPVPDQVTKADPEPVQEQVEVGEVEDVPTTTKKKRERKPGATGRKKTFTLMINCAFVRGGSNILFADKLLQEYGVQIAKAQNVDHFTQINAFDRRDMLVRLVDQFLLDEIHGKTIVATNIQSGSDLKHFVDALMPHTNDIIEAVVN